MIPSEAMTREAFHVAVGGAIRQFRHEFQWTQAGLAKQTGLSPNYIARLERGELGPSLFVARLLCRAFAITLDDLVASASAGAERVTDVRRKTLESQAPLQQAGRRR
jgi:DNA-binding XRE family transcriptional regulator